MKRLVIFPIIAIIGILNAFCEEFEIAYNQDTDQPYWLTFRTLDDAPGTVELIKIMKESDKFLAGELDYYRNYDIDLLDIPSSITNDGNEYSLTTMNVDNGCPAKKVIIPSTVRWIKGEIRSSELEELVIDNAPIEEFEAYGFYYCKNLKSVSFGNACTFTELPWNCFDDCTSLCEVQLPESLQRINAWTFRGCTSLKSINLPSSVTCLDRCFLECTSLEEVNGDGLEEIHEAFVNCESLKSINLPSVKYIGEKAFQNCRNLTSVKTSAVNIGAYAFENCNSLQELPALGSVGEAAFKNCSSLQSISFPSNISIGSQAFAGCISLEKFDVLSSEYGTYSAIDGVLINDGQQLVAYPAGKKDTHYSVPESISSIGNGAFEGALYLTDIALHDNIQELGVMAFRDCQALKQVSMPASLNHVPFGTFSGCNSLENVTMPDSYIYIGPSAFEECSSLAEVTLPSELKVLGESAFADCSKIESIVLPAQVNEIRSNTFKNCESLQSLTLSANTDTIRSGALQGCKVLKQIDLPSTLRSLEDRAFKGCESLESVTIPDAVTEIGINTFEDCSSLKEVTVGNGVKEIGQWAFYNCTDMEKLVLGSSLESIGAEAFDGDINIRDITCLSPEPPTFPGGFPPEVTANATVTVPAGSEYAYNVSDVWDPMVKGEVPRAESISLNFNEIKIRPRETFTLVATVLPEDAIDKSVTWSSDATYIAKVDENGIVTPTAFPGMNINSCIITATTSNGLTDKCLVIISEDDDTSVSVISDEDGCFNIYSPSGTPVKLGADIDYLKNLPKGVYIIRTAKKTFKIVI